MSHLAAAARSLYETCELMFLSFLLYRSLLKGLHVISYFICRFKLNGKHLLILDSPLCDLCGKYFGGKYFICKSLEFLIFGDIL